MADDSSSATVMTFVVGMSLLLGVASRYAVRGTRVPYTVVLLLLGIAIGALEYGTHQGLGKIGDGIRLWANIDPDLLLAVFLPPLLFEGSFSMDSHQINKCMVQMILLAGPGVFLSTFCLGSAIKLALPYNWSWNTCLLLGALLSATDPVAVVALLKELGTSKKLSTIIEGESMMNDGVAMVVFQLFYRMLHGWSFKWGALFSFLSRPSLGAVGIGLAFGTLSILWLRFIFKDTLTEITVTFAVSYIAYFTSQEGAAVSGILTVMALGMFYSAVAQTAFKGESQESLHHFWETVAYIANTLIFILSGVVIAESVLRNDNIFKTHEHSWGYLFLLYVIVQVARLVVIGVFFPFLQYFGCGLDWKEAIILVWSGLRGPVSLALSLSVKHSSDSSSYITSDTGTLFVFLTGGIVLLTLIVNGSTTQFILHILKMDKESAAKKQILDYAKYEMLNEALEAFGKLGDDEDLGPVDWPTVKRYITTLNDVNVEEVSHQFLSNSDDHFRRMNLTDTRVRFLDGVQEAYRVMLAEGRITQTTASVLMRSVAEAIELVSHKVLCDWIGLRSYIHMPYYYKFLQSGIIPEKLVTYFSLQRLEPACCTCAAFLRAHRIARQQLHEFIGDSKFAAVVISESEQEGEEARKFLDDVRVKFPEMLRVIKTRQGIYLVLNHLMDYVHNLDKICLLDEKETSHLRDAVQTDLENLLRNPLLVNIPEGTSLINANPFLGALPSAMRETLVESAKEIMDVRGATLYKEGSQPMGIWLITSGVVKSSKDINNEPLLQPTFTHGSTLGLYEVLTQRPYICDVIMDSAVVYFFIETEKILSLLRSDPAVEDFFWQESITVIAKLMLPQMFERMAVQDIRVLIAERSTMNIYMRGETFQLYNRCVGFLLEGFVKMQCGLEEEMIAAPAAILPGADLNFRPSGTLEVGIKSGGSSLSIMVGWRAGSSFWEVSSYQVQTRARVVVLDIAVFESGSRHHPSSSLLHSMVHPSESAGRDHTGLMSWPEQYFKPRHHDREVEDQKGNDLSSRALRLSIYGTVNHWGDGSRSSYTEEDLLE